MKNNKLLIGLAVFGFAVFSYTVLYPIVDWVFNDREYYRGRFLITATVEVDGEIKTGQSVYEVSYNARRRGGGFGSSPINGARGTMPYIDLGAYGTVVFLFEYNPPVSEIRPFKKPSCKLLEPTFYPTALMPTPEIEYEDTREVIDAVIKAEGQFSLGQYSPYVAIIPPNGKIQGAKVTRFCELNIIYDPKVIPLNILIEHTNLPLSIESSSSPSWLKKWRFDYGVKKKEAENTQFHINWEYLSPFKFEREEFYKG